MKDRLLLRVPWRSLVSAVPNFAFAGAFLITWLDPYRLGPHAVRDGMVLMLVEFIVVHSTGFMAGLMGSRDKKRHKAGMFFGLLLFYCLFVAVFCTVAKSLWPLIGFLGLTLSKFPSIVLYPPKEDVMMPAMSGWAAMTVLYLGGVFATVMFPIPEFGITREVVLSQELGTGGVWQEQPHTVLAFGVIYFTGLGLFELFLHPRLWGSHKKAAPATASA